MVDDISKMPVSKTGITPLTTGLGALSTTYLRILRWIVAMVYAYRDCGGSIFSGE